MSEDDELEVIDLADEPRDEPTIRRPSRRSAPRRATLVAAVVVVVAAGVGLLVWSRHDNKPATRTAAAPTSTVDTAPPVTVVPPKIVTFPAMREVPHAVPVRARRFPWGKGLGEVGTAAGESNYGPQVFTADDEGNYVIDDWPNARLVEHLDGREAEVKAHPQDFACIPSVFGTQRRLIANDCNGGFFVLGADGTRIAHFLPKDLPTRGVSEYGTLVADGPDIYASGPNQRLLMFHDDGAGYRPTPNATSEAQPIYVQAAAAAADGNEPMIGREAERGYGYALDTPWRIAGFPVARLRSDGAITAILIVDKPSNAIPNSPAAYFYVAIAIDRDGNAAIEQFPAPSDHMDDGPAFLMNDSYFSVMSDTDRGGVTVSVYRYPEGLGG